MRLLVLSPCYPFPPQNGVQLRLVNLLRRLPPEYRLTLLCTDRVERVETEPLPEPWSGELVRIPLPPLVSGWRANSLVQAVRPLPSMLWKFRSPLFAATAAEYGRKADAALAVGLQMAQYLDSLPAGVPTAVDNYNVEHRILARMAETRTGPKRLYWTWEAFKLRRAEQRLLRRADAVFAISEVDRDGMAELIGKERLHTVPMGIDLEYFGASGEGLPADPSFAFVGAFNWHVNEDAADWVCSQVWPLLREKLPQAHLTLIGRDPSTAVQGFAKGAEATVTGTVPDIRPYVAASRAMLVPLRYGSGVRTKILEAFAAGRPVISTSVGCEGLPVTNGEHLLIADDAPSFAEACYRLATDEALAASLVRQARRLVEEHDHQATVKLQSALAAAFSRSAGNGKA